MTQSIKLQLEMTKSMMKVHRNTLPLRPRPTRQDELPSSFNKLIHFSLSWMSATYILLYTILVMHKCEYIKHRFPSPNPFSHFYSIYFLLVVYFFGVRCTSVWIFHPKISKWINVDSIAEMEQTKKISNLYFSISWLNAYTNSPLLWQ